MNARALLATFDSVYLMALTAWVGSILFFSFAIAPMVFKVLEAELGGRFLRALFPRYYAWGGYSTAIALASLACATLSYPELRGVRFAIQAGLILVASAIMLYCGNTLTPAINAAKDAGPDAKGRFDQLHRRSVRLNGVALLIGIGLIVGFAVRPAVRTSGIEEMTPQERSAYDREFSEALDQILAGKPRPVTAEPPPRVRFDEAARKELEDLIEARRKKAGAARP